MPDSRTPATLARLGALPSSKLLATAGFLLMLLLMAAVLATGLVYLGEMQANLNRIVAEHNVKMRLVWDMRHAARERAMILHTLPQRQDPFDRDAAIERFNQHARDFIAARAKLAASPMDPTERALLGEALVLARDGEAAQSLFVARVMAGATRDTEAILLQRIMPIQEWVMARLTRLIEHEQRASLAAGDKATQAALSAQRFMLGLGILALAVGAAVAAYVIRRTARIEADLHREKERAQITLDAIGDAVITTDQADRVTYLNPAAERLVGWRSGEGMGRDIDAIVRLASGEGLSSLLRPGPASALSAPVARHAIVSREGQGRTIELSLGMLNDLKRAPAGTVLVLRDVTQADELARRLSWAASHDALTGLINRAEFETRLARLLDATRTGGAAHAILYMDLDQFKVVNDTCGHMAGDDLLRQLAAVLENGIRSGDTLARLGGDEFGLLLEGCPLDRATEIAETLRGTLADFRFAHGDKLFDVGVSIGVAPITAQTESTTTLLSAVDAACYVAKDKGRNQIHVYQPGDHETYLRTGEMQWAQQLSQAIKEERLELYAQKIVPLSADLPEAMHLELLIRMVDEQGQVISPGAFIPAAERYGLMPTLDRWVIRRVFQCLARQGAIPPGSLCAINLSGQTLGDPGILPFIIAQFEATGVAPGHICFEITETAAVANLRAAGHFIQALRALGCRFSLDDFGSGMSSFGYLRQLEVDFLKIDGAFVKDIVRDPTDRAMVEAIDKIGHVMGLRTIAEFVENEEIADLLRQIGVDFAQGYGIHKPEPIDRVMASGTSAPAAGPRPEEATARQA